MEKRRATSEKLHRMAHLKTYKELIVWQKSIQLVELIYRLTKIFPKEEQFGLSSQMRRAAVSIPSNVAEGWSRRTRGDFAYFLRISSGSTSELETQLEIARRLSLVDDTGYNETDGLLSEISKMLNSMLRKLPVG